MKPPEYRRDGDEHHFTFADEGVRLMLDRVEETNGRLYGVAWAFSTLTSHSGLTYWGHHGLDSSRSRGDLAGELSRSHPAIDKEQWREMVLYACVEVGKAIRGTIHGIDLADVPRRVGERSLFPGIPLGETTSVYADGETGKSTLGRILALATVTGRKIAGYEPAIKGDVMILDYETNEAEYAEAMLALCRGIGLTEIPRGIHYYEMQQPLVYALPRLRAEASHNNVVFIFVDSIIAALHGAAKDDEAAKAFMNALRSFAPATRMAATHITKEAALGDADGKKVPATAFGSRFFHAYSRSQFELSKWDEREGVSEIVLRHKKFNRGRKLMPITLKFTFAEDDNTITCERIQNQKAELEAMDHQQKIRFALGKGAKDSKQLEAETGLTGKALSTAIRRMSDVITLDAGGGRGRVARYGLADPADRRNSVMTGNKPPLTEFRSPNGVVHPNAAARNGRFPGDQDDSVVEESEEVAF